MPGLRPSLGWGAGGAAAALLGLAAGAVTAAPAGGAPAVGLAAVGSLDQGAALESPAPRAPAAADSTARSEVALGLAAPVKISSDGIADTLPGAVAGDAASGRAIVASRQVGLCLLCHAGPIPEEPFQGNLAPDLAGAGDRSSAAQLRLRIADASRLNPDTIMPSYFRTGGLNRVASSYREKPILSAQQIEDVVAYLQTLRDAPDARPQ
ncbi:MAG TPA: sulfur oxidation c-type cytochrome SoxX [Lautropia sp.]|nr:sulfur oxidation c-type cytochrome SoxX [Lautropia sp.]